MTSGSSAAFGEVWVPLLSILQDVLNLNFRKAQKMQKTLLNILSIKWQVGDVSFSASGLATNPQIVGVAPHDSVSPPVSGQFSVSISLRRHRWPEAVSPERL